MITDRIGSSLNELDELDRIQSGTVRIRMDRQVTVALMALRYWWIIIGMAFFIGLFLGQGLARAEEGWATYYTKESCQREGTSGIWTTSQERYDESAFTAATRSGRFGDRLRVCRVDGSAGHEPELSHRACVVVRRTDFGPGRAAAARGVVIDLTPAAYDALGCRRGINKQGIAWGHCAVAMERIRGPG